jgi:two-component system chemotaxis sensor kinase CheA
VSAIAAAGMASTGLPDASAIGAPAGPAVLEKRKWRILVVEDSITTRTLEQSILEAAGYEVATAVDGAEGLRWLQEHPCDLIVADVEMPRMDGLALCRAVRASARLKQLPVVLVTARESAEDRSHGLEAGADAYLGKSSFDQQGLLETVRQLIG